MSRPLRIGLVDYLNPAPFYWDLERRLAGRAEFVRGVPAEVNAALLEGSVDASFVSSVFAGAHADEFLIVPGLGVSARGPVGSVLLFAWVERLEQLAGQRIALTRASASSVRLLRVLLDERCVPGPEYRTVDPDLSGMLAEHEAALVIGDRALAERLRARAFRDPRGAERVPAVFDLGQLWLERTGLPITFALWAARRDASERLRAADFATELRASLAGGLAHLDAIAAEGAERLGLQPDDCRRYLERLEYELPEDVRRGLDAFLDAALADVPRVPLEFLE